MTETPTTPLASTKTFAAAARERRARLGWTVRELAKRSETTLTTTQRAVTTGHVQLSVALRIAAALGLDTGDLGGEQP